MDESEDAAIESLRSALIGARDRGWKTGWIYFLVGSGLIALVTTLASQNIDDPSQVYVTAGVVGLIWFSLSFFQFRPRAFVQYIDRHAPHISDYLKDFRVYTRIRGHTWSADYEAFSDPELDCGLYRYLQFKARGRDASQRFKALLILFLIVVAFYAAVWWFFIRGNP